MNAVWDFIEAIELRIKKSLRENGLAQKDFVELIGVNQGTISAYLNASVIYSRIEDIADLLGTTPNRLLFGEDESIPVVFKYWKDLTKTQKAFIAAMIENFNQEKKA